MIKKLIRSTEWNKDIKLDILINQRNNILKNAYLFLRHLESSIYFLLRKKKKIPNDETINFTAHKTPHKKQTNNEQVIGQSNACRTPQIPAINQKWRKKTCQSKEYCLHANERKYSLYRLSEIARFRLNYFCIPNCKYVDAMRSLHLESSRWYHSDPARRV